MEYKTEKDLTLKQNKVVYEEVYMDCDMSADKYIEGTGWNLKYPSQFSINHSKDKSIAPRRTLLEPKDYTFYMRVAYRDSVTGTTEITHAFLVQINRKTTIADFVSGLPEYADTYYDDVNGNPNTNEAKFQILCVYDPNLGRLVFAGAYRDTTDPQNIVTRDCDIAFLFANASDISKFTELVNQKQNSPEIQTLCRQIWGWDRDDEDSYTSGVMLWNVWNRDQLCLHASFSSSQKRYLCFSNEFWERPSKIYFDNTYGSEFTVYYTTDGTHKIVPLYAHKLIELSFVLRTSTL